MPAATADELELGPAPDFSDRIAMLELQLGSTGAPEEGDPELNFAGMDVEPAAKARKMTPADSGEAVAAGAGTGPAAIDQIAAAHALVVQAAEQPQAALQPLVVPAPVLAQPAFIPPPALAPPAPPDTSKTIQDAAQAALALQFVEAANAKVQAAQAVQAVGALELPKLAAGGVVQAAPTMVEVAPAILETAIVPLGAAQAPAPAPEPQAAANPANDSEARTAQWAQVFAMMVQVGLDDRAGEYATTLGKLQEETQDLLKRYNESMTAMDQLLSNAYGEVVQANLVTQLQVQAQQEVQVQGSQVQAEIQAAHKAAAAAVAGQPERGRLPRRPGIPECQYYMRTGDCHYGPSCKWDHPERLSTPLNSRGFPLRPGEVDCAFYMRSGDCKFGERCKFNHPDNAGPAQFTGKVAAALAGLL